jgi:hypothetical protein
MEGTQFNGYKLIYVSGVQLSIIVTIKNDVRPIRKLEIHYGGFQTESIHISACRHESNEIQIVIYVFVVHLLNGTIWNALRLQLLRLFLKSQIQVLYLISDLH